MKNKMAVRLLISVGLFSLFLGMSSALDDIIVNSMMRPCNCKVEAEPGDKLTMFYIGYIKYDDNLTVFDNK